MLEKIEGILIEAARKGDEAALRELFEPLSRELHVYAYRMLGGFQDAEDALQEARLKAWRSLESYEPRAGFRAWMFRIVTNTCLDMLRTRRRRVLPRDVSPPVEPGPPPTDRRPDLPWLEPYPDALLPDRPDPEAALLLRESIRLAFIRAMQLLPPRQRAALILHDVLDWSATDVATMLETTVPAVRSALQRARGTISRSDAGAPRSDDLEARRRGDLSLVRAWETGDIDDLVSLAEDASMSMPPWLYWLDGCEAVAAALRSLGPGRRAARRSLSPRGDRDQRPTGGARLRARPRRPLHVDVPDGADRQPGRTHLRDDRLRTPRALRRLGLRADSRRRHRSELILCVHPKKPRVSSIGGGGPRANHFPLARASPGQGEVRP
jgi:RNA polymerase sigma-70 factor (ECF subfamily)